MASKREPRYIILYRDGGHSGLTHTWDAVLYHVERGLRLPYILQPVRVERVS